MQNQNDHETLPYFPYSIGDTYTVRRYNAARQPLTGPGTGKPDLTVQVRDIGGYPIGKNQELLFQDSQGNKQFFLYLKDDSTKRNGIAVSRITGKAYDIRLRPPLFILQLPVPQKERWGPYTIKASAATWPRIKLEYSGVMDGPMELTTPAGTFTDVFQVTIAYKATLLALSLLSGEDYFWFAPTVGLIQHGFIRGPYVIIPDRQLVTTGLKETNSRNET